LHTGFSSNEVLNFAGGTAGNIKIMKMSLRMKMRRMFEKEYVWINVLS
jgi:hypothetical protein